MDFNEAPNTTRVSEQPFSVTPNLVQIYDAAKALYQLVIAEKAGPMSLRPKSDITSLFDELSAAGPKNFPGWHVHTSESVLEETLHKRVIFLKGNAGGRTRDMVVEYYQDEGRGFKKVSIVDMSDSHARMRINITTMRDNAEYSVSVQNGEYKRNILIGESGLTTIQSDSTPFSKEVEHLRQGQLLTISSGDLYNQPWKQMLLSFDSYGNEVKNLQKAS